MVWIEKIFVHEFVIKAKASILNVYLSYAKITIFALAIVMIFFFIYSYNTERQRVERSLIAESANVTSIVEGSLDYISLISRNVAEQASASIKSNGGLEEIAHILNTFQADPEIQEILTNTMFAWSNIDGKILVNGMEGIVKKDINISYRDYFIKAKLYPNDFIISEPDIGVMSYRRIIPTIIASTNESGEILGFISTGLDMEKMNKKIDAQLKVPNASFLILSPKNQVATEVPSGKMTVDYKTILDKFIANPSKGSSGIISEPGALGIGNKPMIVYQQSKKYNFISVVILDDDFVAQDFLQFMTPRIIEAAIFISLLLLFLHTIRRRIVFPIVELSNVADKMSKGETLYMKDQSGEFSEISNLAIHLERLSEYLQERKTIESELRAKTIQLKQARDVAEKANRGKSEFLAFMSHEIRTPLNAIIAFSDLMRSQALGPINNPRYIEYLFDINKSCNYIIGIMADLVDVTKAESGLIELNKQDCDLSQLISDTIRVVKDAAEVRKINISYSSALTDNHDSTAILDEIRVKQILLNLISNSIKFTPEQGSIVIHLSSITKGQEKWLVIEVTDSGFGMDEKDLPIALSKFGQIDNNRSSTIGEGIGLGLPISRMLTELHGGELLLSSKKGAGTKITISIPSGKYLRIAAA